MSKTLAIIRHGKSTWDYGTVADLDRPLKENGISNTILVAQKIRSRAISPDLILSSPAVRALSTALIVARELHYSSEKIEITPGLYSDSEDEILEIVHAIDASVKTLFIFGHNPVFTTLPNMFLSKQIDNLPTSGVVLLQFDTENWSDISRQNLKSEECLFPKLLSSE